MVGGESIEHADIDSFDEELKREAAIEKEKLFQVLTWQQEQIKRFSWSYKLHFGEPLTWKNYFQVDPSKPTESEPNKANRSESDIKEGSQVEGSVSDIVRVSEIEDGIWTSELSGDEFWPS